MKLPRYTLPAVAALLLLPLAPRCWAEPVISEFMSQNLTGLRDEDNDFSDWIEIQNTGSEALSLEGYFLTDDPENLAKWEFPGVNLGVGEYLLLFASGKNRTVPGAELHTNFALNVGGEYLALVGPDETSVLYAYGPEYPNQEPDKSYGMVNGGAQGFLNAASPGESNGSGRVAELVQFSVPPSTFTGSLTVELSASSGGRIQYATNGNKPSLLNGTTYSGPITLTDTTELRAAVSGGPVTTVAYIRLENSLANFTSNLPLVIMDNLNGARFNGSTSNRMHIAILEPGEDGRTSLLGTYAMSSRGGAKHRGSSSQGWPKKNFRIEFWSENDGEDKDHSPAGLPADSDFILSGRYQFDLALMRNPLIYELSNQIGRYATRTRFCEVYVNENGGAIGDGDYQGVYALMETIKRGRDRVDVPQLDPDDLTAPDVTGGYMMKIDRADPGDGGFSAAGQPIRYVDPKEDEIEAAGRAPQRNYIRDHMNAFRNTLRNPDPDSGYPAWIDVDSWIDHMHLNILMMNVDALRLSAYFYKERDTVDPTPLNPNRTVRGKIVFGPIWDFDRSAGSTDGRTTRWDTWRTNSGDRGTDFFNYPWWNELFEDPDFLQRYADRWHELRQGAFSVENIHAVIDGMGAELQEGAVRNFAKWGRLSATTSAYQGQVNLLKDWLENRVEWIDDNGIIDMPGFSVEPGVVPQGTQLRLTGGSILQQWEMYYTTDGSDPRAPGGAPAAGATRYVGDIELNDSVTITARRRHPNFVPLRDGYDQEWSPPLVGRFLVGVQPAAAGNVIISEIMYHPAAPSAEEVAAGFRNQDDFEFIELLNVADVPIDLFGVGFTDGIEFTFTAPLIVPAGGRVVLVDNADAFAMRYGTGITVAGVYTGSLRNQGEGLAFNSAAGAAIQAFIYDDRDPWPTAADGDGFSLVFDETDPAGDPADAAKWRASGARNGSPGSEDVPAENRFVDWLAERFDAAERADMAVSGPFADPDRDGVPNVLEYAFGTGPKDGGSRRFPRSAVEAHGGAERFLTLRFTRPAGADAGAEYVVEVSGDLLNWISGAAATVEVGTEDNGDGTETVTVRDNAEAAQGGNRFARIRVRLRE